MKRVLFVDDEPSVVQGLRRMLHSLRNEWEMTFVSSGREALACMSVKEIDVIITDMRMPQMNGAQLLAEVKRLHPGTIRIILSGYSDRELIMQSVGSAHNYLAKPCEPSELKATVEHSFVIQEMVNDERIRSKVMSLEALPMLPATYQKLIAALGDEKSDIDSISDIIRSDVGISAKVLHLINSAFFGRSSRVENIGRAVSLLGLETIRSLVLTTGVFEQFSDDSINGESLERVYSHCVEVGNIAAKVARALKHEKEGIESALLAGMMHDVGKAIFLTSFREQMQEAFKLAGERKTKCHLVEDEILGVTHAEVGGYLLSLWGEAHDKVEAVALHHHPSRTEFAKSNTLTAVHIADAISRRPKYDDIETWKEQELDMEYLEKLGLVDQVLDMVIDLAPVPEEVGG